MISGFGFGVMLDCVFGADTTGDWGGEGGTAGPESWLAIALLRNYPLDWGEVERGMDGEEGSRFGMVGALGWRVRENLGEEAFEVLEEAK